MNSERVKEIVDDIIQYTESITIAKMIVEHPTVFKADLFITAQNQRVIKLSEARIKDLTAELILLTK